MCVCVCERERERDRQTDRIQSTHKGRSISVTYSLSSPTICWVFEGIMARGTMALPPSRSLMSGVNLTVPVIVRHAR